MRVAASRASGCMGAEVVEKTEMEFWVAAHASLLDRERLLWALFERYEGITSCIGVSFSR